MCALCVNAALVWTVIAELCVKLHRLNGNGTEIVEAAVYSEENLTLQSCLQQKAQTSDTCIYENPYISNLITADVQEQEKTPEIIKTAAYT